MFACRVSMAFFVRLVLARIERLILEGLVPPGAGWGTDSHPRCPGRLGTMDLGRTDWARLEGASLPRPEIRPTPRPVGVERERG
jgi:hypothetical protein